MRYFIAVLYLLALPLSLPEVAAPAGSDSTEATVALYDPNHEHLWNQLYEALLIREGPTGAKYGADSLDPLLWQDTKHLLAQPSHEHALRVLEQFLQTHAENLVHDPVKRAILQRDLWSVFDWSAQVRPDDDGGPGYQKER